MYFSVRACIFSYYTPNFEAGKPKVNKRCRHFRTCCGCFVCGTDRSRWNCQHRPAKSCDSSRAHSLPADWKLADAASSKHFRKSSLAKRKQNIESFCWRGACGTSVPVAKDHDGGQGSQLLKRRSSWIDLSKRG